MGGGLFQRRHIDQNNKISDMETLIFWQILVKNTAESANAGLPVSPLIIRKT